MLLTDHLCQNMCLSVINKHVYRRKCLPVSPSQKKTSQIPPSNKKNVSVGNDVWVCRKGGKNFPPSNKNPPEIVWGGAPAYSSPKT